LQGQSPKYISAGKRHVYNTVALDEADRTGEIAITEGELDAVTATELYGVPAVAVPGATNWTANPLWRHLFTGYDRVWVLADPDEAGLKMASAVLEDLPAARLVTLPADVNDCWLQNIDIKALMK
jgi:DNA primase